MWGFVPEHLGKEFAEDLDDIRLERMDLKSKGLGKSNASELLKLAMNGGFYGNTNNKHTPMEDVKAMLSITINGQLMLLMLAERLNEIGVYIDSANTDGLTIKYDKSVRNKVLQIRKEWEEETKCGLEEVQFSKVIRTNVNNYLAIPKEGKVKEKGMFLTDPPVDQSRDNLVIPKALQAYYLHGTPIETFIRSHKNIYDFCSSQKVDRKYTIFYNGEKQQRLNRYYVSTDGAYLYKSQDNGITLNHMMKGWGVTLFNDFEEKEDYKIDYRYYISKCKEILEELESNQLSLF